MSDSHLPYEDEESSETEATSEGGASSKQEKWDSDLIQSRLAAGINRSITVVLGTQISSRLTHYFSLSKILVILTAVHSLLSVSDPLLGELKASWKVIKGLVQSLLIQSIVSYLTSSSSQGVVLFNVLVFLVIAECVPTASGWTHEKNDHAIKHQIDEDKELFLASVSYIFSDEVGALLVSWGVPLVGASLGLFLGGQGIIGQTLMLTGVNALCSIAFGSINGGELSIAWPVVLLYFVNEVVGQFSGVQAFVDYGLYKVSDSVYSGLLGLGVHADVIGLVFLILIISSFFLDEINNVFYCSPRICRFFKDQLWFGLCMLVVVRAATDWFLDCVALAIHCDPIFGGLCVIAAIQFATLGVGLVTGHSYHLMK